VDNNIDLKEQTEILVKLQSIDSGKKQISAMLSKVDETFRKLDDELDTSRAIVEKNEGELDDLRKKYREIEIELNMRAPRIEKSKEKLRAVKNNKEYQSLLKEIEDLKKQSSSLEDNMLECLEKIESSEASVKKSELEFRAIEKRIQGEKREVDKENEKGKLELEALNVEWEQVSAAVAPEIMKTFDRIRTMVWGVAIAPVINEVCQACNMNIPPQLYNDLQRFESLKFCPSCQRIIYWKNES
jgi:predicted  nucleic acid-binding Zn-ribbon protein